MKLFYLIKKELYIGLGTDVNLNNQITPQSFIFKQEMVVQSRLPKDLKYQLLIDSNRNSKTFKWKH
jgi:hypothetical protein